MISEWLQVMLDEIERKRVERVEAVAEDLRRRLDGAQTQASQPAPAGSPTPL